MKSGKRLSKLLVERGRMERKGSRESVFGRGVLRGRVVTEAGEGRERER